jgi:aminopeptidase N
MAAELLLGLAKDASAGARLVLDPSFIDAFAALLADPTIDGSFKALAMTLPDERVLAQSMEVVDVDGLHAARVFAKQALAARLRGPLRDTYEANRARGPYSPSKEAIDKRRLKNTALAYLVCLDEPATRDLVVQQFAQADNMTDAQTALVLLSDLAAPAREEALASFYTRWKDDPLVLDKWFSIQAISSRPSATAEVLALTNHPDFTLHNPNRARALLGAFSMRNQVRFHGADGRGYTLLADAVIELDRLNPQVAARLVSAFNPWRRFDEARQALMKAELVRIRGGYPELSNDVYELVSRALAPAAGA